MKPSLLTRIGVSIIAYSALAYIVYLPVSCVNNYRKYKACLTQPSEMVAVETYPEPQDITEIVHKVKEVAKKDYKTAIKELKTPLEASIYCTKIIEYENDIKVYGKKDYWASFKHIHKNKKDDCDGGALAAAAILSDDGFPPYIAVISNEGIPVQAHAIFVYKTTKGKYGSIGINGFDCRTGYDSIEELVGDMGFSYFQIYNISKYNPDYIDNDKNNDVRKLK